MLVATRMEAIATRLEAIASGVAKLGKALEVEETMLCGYTQLHAAVARHFKTWRNTANPLVSKYPSLPFGSTCGQPACKRRR